MTPLPKHLKETKADMALAKREQKKLELLEKKKEKLLNLFKHLDKACSNEFKPIGTNSLRRKHKLDNKLFTNLINEGFLSKKGNHSSSRYQWNYPNPNLGTVEKFLEFVEGTDKIKPRAINNGNDTEF